MAWHFVEDKLLSDDEFKQHQRNEGLGAIFVWLFPAVGWIAVCYGVGLLFPVWCEANPWFIFPILLLAIFRAGLFETIGAITVIVGFIILMFDVYNG